MMAFYCEINKILYHTESTKNRITNRKTVIRFNKRNNKNKKSSEDTLSAFKIPFI